nr:uncharacterized protein LOC108391123 isoform X3 [Manis javanica]
MRAWPQAPGRLLRDGMSLLLPLTEGPPRPLGCPFPLVPIPPAPAPLRYRRRTQLRSRGRPASSRLCGKPSLPGGSACAERLRRGRLSSEKSSLQPPAVGRRHAVVISSSVSLVRSCRATSVWGIQLLYHPLGKGGTGFHFGPTGPPTRRAQCLLDKEASSQCNHLCCVNANYHLQPQETASTDLRGDRRRELVVVLLAQMVAKGAGFWREKTRWRHPWRTPGPGEVAAPCEQVLWFLQLQGTENFLKLDCTTSAHAWTSSRRRAPDMAVPCHQRPTALLSCLLPVAPHVSP